MRLANRMVTVAAVALAMLAIGGCKGKQGTPKGLLEKLQEAGEKLDNGAMVECTEPDAQKTMKDIVPVMEERKRAAKEAAAAVDKKIGKDEAKLLSIMGGSGGDKSISPLGAVVKDGKVDWSKVKIKEDGDKATVELDGKKADQLDMKKVDGKWYLAMPEKARPSADQAKKLVEQTKNMVAGLKELTRKVNDGKVTKNNFSQEFDKVMKGE